MIPLQQALRELQPGRPQRDRLLLERWAQAYENNLIDDTVLAGPRSMMTNKPRSEGDVLVGDGQDYETKRICVAGGGVPHHVGSEGCRYEKRSADEYVTDRDPGDENTTSQGEQA